MSIRSALAISGLIALAATPLAAQADGSGRATDACIAAFVETYVPEGRTVRVHKSEPAAGPLAYYTKQYTIALSAHSASGVEIAQARCVASRRGDVIVLDRPLPETYVARADVKAAVVR